MPGFSPDTSRCTHSAPAQALFPKPKPAYICKRAAFPLHFMYFFIHLKQDFSDACNRKNNELHRKLYQLSYIYLQFKSE